MNNVTGWNELMNGSVVNANYIIFNSYMAGYFLLAFWLLISAIVYMKQDEPLIPFVIGLIMFSIFYTYLNPSSIFIIIIILAFELAGVLYKTFEPK